MVSRNPLFDVCDRLGQWIEFAVAALKHQEQAGEEQLGVNTTLAIARMQLLVQSSCLGRCAQQPEQKGRERGDEHQYAKRPTPLERLRSRPSPKCWLFMSRKLSSICMRWR